VDIAGGARIIQPKATQQAAAGARVYKLGTSTSWHISHSSREVAQFI
jgi:hypothetical protein